MNDTLHTGKETSDKLISGIKKVADAVKVTMGTGGSNAIIQAIESPGHLLTNDGWTIANSIRLADPIEEMGRKILLEAINRANKQSGDGSSTTCLLTASILEEGMKHIGEVSPMEIKKSLEECVPLIEAALLAQKIDITVDEVGQVASISAEDQEIGAMIQEIYQKIGKEGIIQWDISKTFKDHYTIGNGITIEGAGMASPYMADMEADTGNFQSVARWHKPKILITKQKIMSAGEFNDLFQALDQREIKEVVVFCDEYEAAIIPDLIRTRAIRGFRTLLVKMPVFWKDAWFEDLAKATGATIIDPHAGTSLKLMKIEHLGTVEHITVTKTDTFIDGIKDISEHIKKLQEDGTDESLLRASRLNTRTARYFVGAQSDSALSYRRLKVEDAISASWQALQNGVVAGGGVSLRNCAKLLPNTVGGRILKKALIAPIKQIAENSGMTSSDSVNQHGNHGLNSKTGEIVNMIEAGIIDPANVAINACRNAISVSAAILTASSVVLLPVSHAKETV